MPLTLSERTLAISPSVTLAIDARAKQLRDNDRTTGRKGGKNIDDQNIQHIDQRYAGNRSLAD